MIPHFNIEGIIKLTFQSLTLRQSGYLLKLTPFILFDSGRVQLKVHCKTMFSARTHCKSTYASQVLSPKN